MVPQQFFFLQAGETKYDPNLVGNGGWSSVDLNFSQNLNLYPVAYGRGKGEIRISFSFFHRQGFSKSSRGGGLLHPYSSRIFGGSPSRGAVEIFCGRLCYIKKMREKLARSCYFRSKISGKNAKCGGKMVRKCYFRPKNFPAERRIWVVTQISRGKSG